MLAVGSLCVLVAIFCWARVSGDAAEQAPATLAVGGEEAVEREQVAPPLAPPARVSLGAPYDASAETSTAAHTEPAVGAGRVLAGVVLLPDRTPAPKARLSFVWRDDGRAREVRAWGDGAGRFAFALEAPDLEGELVACDLDQRASPVVRSGVRAGASDLELVLGPPSLLTLEVRDAHERPVADVAANVTWQIGGAPVSGDAPPDSVGGEPVRWPRPPAPFTVSLFSPAFAEVRFGPFDPAQLGETLVLHVERYPTLSGRVIRRGEPVSGASVQLTSSAPRTALDVELEAPRLGGFGRTDDHGEFQFPYYRPGPYDLRAWADGKGASESRPLALDGNPVEGLELELAHDTGAIEGRVRLPSGREAQELWLSVSSGGYRRLHADGTFRLPDLLPGACRIRVVKGMGFDLGEGAEEWIHISHGPSRPPDWLPVQPTYTVEVHSGETAHLDIDLVTPAAYRLRGVLHLDGRTPSVRTPIRSTAEVPPRIALDRGQIFDLVSTTDLAADGSFTLEAAEPGTYRLRTELELAGGKLERWTVLDRVVLTADPAEWRLDVATGSLRVLPADVASSLGSFRAFVRWAGAAEQRVFVHNPDYDASRGARLFPHVPAGTVQLVEDGTNGRRVLLECEVRAGETTEVRWPQ